MRDLRSLLAAGFLLRGRTRLSPPNSLLEGVDLSQLFAILCERYPGRSTRLPAYASRIFLFVQVLLVGKRILHFGDVIVRDHKNNVVAKCVFSGVMQEIVAVRGLRFAWSSTRDAHKRLMAQPASLRMSPWGVFATMSALVYASAVEKYLFGRVSVWRGTVVTADQSPATQVLGILSNRNSVPVAMAHFNPGRSPLSDPSNRPAYNYVSAFRFADTEIVGGRSVPTTLVFERQEMIATGQSGGNLRAGVVVVLGYSTRLVDVLPLVVRLLSLRTPCRITIRPHPRRIWPARLLAALPSVAWQDSRHSTLAFAAERGDVVFMTTVGTPAEAAQSMPCDVYGLASLNGPAAAKPQWEEAVAKNLRSGFLRVFLPAVPTRSACQHIFDAALRKHGTFEFVPQDWKLDSSLRLLERRVHLTTLRSGENLSRAIRGISQTDGEERVH